MAVGLDLIQSVVEQLNQSLAIESAFSETWNQSAQTGVAKFFADVIDQVAPPYCLIKESGEQYDFMTMSGMPGMASHPFTAKGQMSFKVFAATRLQARQLGYALAETLNDAPLSWPSQNDTMLFRMGRSWFIPMTEPSGPGTAILFCRAFLFEYEYSASIEMFS